MATTKKATGKKPVKKKKATLKKVCRSVIKQEGVNQRTGKLKAGYKYKKGGGVVKVTAKAAAKKKPTNKSKGTKKK